MRALTWQGRHDVRVETVPDPEIVNPRDAILRVTSTAICGSDLHLYDGYIPTLRGGDVLGPDLVEQRKIVEVEKRIGHGLRQLAVGRKEFKSVRPLPGC